MEPAKDPPSLLGIPQQPPSRLVRRGRVTPLCLTRDTFGWKAGPQRLLCFLPPKIQRKLGSLILSSAMTHPSKQSPLSD